MMSKTALSGPVGDPSTVAAHPPAPDAPRIDFIQSMRGIAALLVVLYHVTKELHRAGVLPSDRVFHFAESGNFGVDLFFIISGFIMVYVTHGKPAGPGAAADFLLKRIIRVGPVYWFFTFLTLAIMSKAPSLMNAANFTPAYVVASLLFVPWPNDNYASMLPLVGVGWTLNYEMIFYVLYAVLLASMVRRRIAVLVGVLACIALAGVFVPKTMPQIWFWSHSIILEFAFGALVASFHLTTHARVGLPKMGIAGLLLVLLGTGLWQAGYWFREDWVRDARGLVSGIPAAMIMLGIACAPRLQQLLSTTGGWRAPQKLGDISYSLYLSHMFAIRVGGLILKRTVPIGYWPVYFVFELALALGFGALVHRFLERPTLRLGKLVGLRRGRLPQSERPAQSSSSNVAIVGAALGGHDVSA